MKKSDILIIGSGMAALTSAALLGKHGKSVTVLEQYNKPGGYLHCFSRHGCRFDTGAHYVGAIGEGQSFRALLNYLGVFDPDHFIKLDSSGFDVFHFPERTIEIPMGYDNLISELTSHFPKDADAIVSYFDLVHEAVRYFPTYHLAGESHVEMPSQFLEKSLQTVVESLTANPQLRSVFYAYCALHGVFPKDVAFGFHALVTDSLIKGAYGFTKGGDALANALVRKIESQGGQVLLNEKVTEIHATDRMVDRVTTAKGEVYQAEWIISGIHPKATFSILKSDAELSPAFKQRLEGLEESVGIFGVYLACKPEVKMSPLKNYYYFASSEPEPMFKTQTPTTVPNTVFASPANRLFKKSDPVFPLNLHAGSPIEWFNQWRGTRYGRRPKEYTEVKEQFAENIFSLVEKYQPGFRSLVQKHQSSTPLSNLHFNGSEDGSAFGIYHSIQNTGMRAIGPRTKVLNLLLTGQSSLFPGIMAAATAGLRTSSHLLGMKHLIHGIKDSSDHEVHL